MRQGYYTSRRTPDLTVAVRGSKALTPAQGEGKLCKHCGQRTPVKLVSKRAKGVLVCAVCEHAY